MRRFEFTKEEIINIFEVANESFKNADLFDMAERLDLSDEEMRNLRDKLSAYMEYDLDDSFLEIT